MPELREVERARALIAEHALGRVIAALERATVGGRTTYWCPREQR